MLFCKLAFDVVLLFQDDKKQAIFHFSIYRVHGFAPSPPVLNNIETHFIYLPKDLF